MILYNKNRKRFIYEGLHEEKKCSLVKIYWTNPEVTIITFNFPKKERRMPMIWLLQPSLERIETVEATTTHMLHIPTVVCLAHGQDQPEMSDNCSSGENHISLVQASQIPVQTIKISLTSLNP